MSPRVRRVAIVRHCYLKRVHSWASRLRRKVARVDAIAPHEVRVSRPGIKKLEAFSVRTGSVRAWSGNGHLHTSTENWVVTALDLRRRKR